MSTEASIADVVHQLSRQGFEHKFGQPCIDVNPDLEWQKVRQTGTALWLDTGDIDEATKLWNAEFSALTTNNTLLNKEIQKGIYDDLVGQTAKAIRSALSDISQKDLLLEIAFVLNAYHGLRLVDQFDAHVSVELHTDLANDVDRTVAYGMRYFAICPERFYVKVPFTPAGLLAARILGEKGVPINFTLGFSARQNVLAALLTKPSYVNVFMGRLNAFVADNHLGTGDNVGEKATLATQRELVALREERRTPSQLIGASMRSAAQVGSLAGLDVYTMPTSVAESYKQDPDPAPSPRIHDDPTVEWAAGVDVADFNGTTLWDVPDAFRTAVDELLEKNLDTMSPEDLQVYLEEAGWGDLLPRWTENDIQKVTADGKIPVYDHWKDRLACKEIGLDALMNISALQSFTVDQKALDERVASVVA